MLGEIVGVGDRAPIFSHFAEMGSILQQQIQDTFGKEVLVPHGGVSRRQRDRMVERFQDAGNGPPVFILSLRAGGAGLNLTAANHVFHYDRWWNPAVENQTTDPDAFWGQPEEDDDYDDLIGPVRVPDEPAALPRQLGRFPFWQGSEEFLPALEVAYRRASRVGSELYLDAESPPQLSAQCVEGLDADPSRLGE